MPQFFQNKAGREEWSVGFHHLEMEAADGLYLSEGKRVVGVGILEVEIVGSPSLGVAVLIAVGGDGEKCVCLVIHEVAPHLVRTVCEAGGMLIIGRSKEDNG
jgi:hypothetical protein